MSAFARGAVWLAAMAAAACGSSDTAPGDAAASFDGSPTVDGAIADARVAIDGVPDPGPDAGDLLWADDFEGTTGAIQDHDPSWVPIFGQLDVDAADGAVRADPGPEDGRDDYGYKPQAATSVVITADVHGNHSDAVGVLVVCPPGAQDESLYELSIYADRLQLFRYDGGGNPSVYETLAQSPALALGDADYRLTMTATLEAGTWTLAGELRSAAGARIATVGPTQDATHGASIGQGIGIYDNSQGASRIYGMSVRGR